METKRLIPYSVHLLEDIYKKLKAAAGERTSASRFSRGGVTRAQFLARAASRTRAVIYD